MSIYYDTRTHRKVYEQHFGPIPTDKDGRSYEIHHNDGNHNNNDPMNLKAMTIQEHYDIHYAQEDWAACLLISIRMKISPEEKSELSRKANLKRVEDGTHPFLGGKVQHETQSRLVKDGTHHWCGDNARQRIEKEIESGTHPGTKVFAKHHICPHCGKEGKGAVMYKHHYDNCKIQN